MQPPDPNYWTPGDDTQAPAVQSSSVVESASTNDNLGPDFVAWEASEYLQHDNGMGWYIGFFAAAVVLITFAIFIVHLWLFAVVVLLMAVAGIIHVRQPPKIIQYRLDDEGFHIDGVNHPYASFKSFSIIRDGAFFAILLMPARRIAMSTIVYFDEPDGEDIVDALGAYLPMEHRELAALDRFLRVVRF